jgi:cyclohexanone monooxygenase
VDVRNNKPTDPDFAATLEPGWQKRRMDNFASLLTGRPQDEDLVNDAWTEVARSMTLFVGDAVASPEEMELADFRKMEQLRERISAIVRDPETAEALKPWYDYACKRPCFSDEYLQAFNRPNVTLVNTDGRGLERITETGFEVGGTAYDVDCLIFATGFDSFQPIYETGEFDVIGRGGLSLAEHWRHRFTSLHGMYAHGFPNLFISGGKPQTASTANAPHILEEQANHIAAVIRQCRDRGIAVMEVREDAEERWAEVIASKRIDREAFFEACTPGYYNFEGAKDRPSILSQAYGGGPFEFLEVCAQWRRTGFDSDLDLTGRT